LESHQLFLHEKTQQTSKVANTEYAVHASLMVLHMVICYT
jgi:hypothetical protein